MFKCQKCRKQIKPLQTQFSFRTFHVWKDGLQHARRDILGVKKVCFKCYSKRHGGKKRNGKIS